ncbi:MAG: hypothetical protein ACP5Q4_01825 [Candidatus Caldatribacteriaceae bacterium]
MKYGLFFKDTSFSVPKREIMSSDFLLGEIATLERIIAQELAAPSRCVPVVSAFLGAKKFSIKRAEIQYISTLPVKEFLYCFDMKNIKFGLFEAFQEEINTLVEENNRIAITLYLPVDYFSDSELEQVLQFISRKPTSLLVFIEGESDLPAKTHRSLSKISQFVEAGKVQCLFRNREKMFFASSSVSAMGIQKIACFK